MPAVLGQSFWEKLSRISSSVGLDPADLLAVMYFESAGLNPAAQNKDGNASGLIQFMPSTLAAVGYKGTPEEFRQLDANSQLDYVSNYVLGHARAVNGHFRSATQYYVANLWPAALKLPGVQNEDPDTVILEKNPIDQKYPGVSLRQEAAAYAANQVLDTNHDGKITYGDLDATMQNVKRSSGFRHALEVLSSGGELAVGKNAPHTSTSPTSPPNKLTQVENMLETFWKAFSSQEISQRYLIKKAYKNNLLANDMSIKIQSDDFETSIEFARILCAALDEDFYTDGIIHTDRKDVEISCTVYGPRQLSVNAILQFCDALSETFEEATNKIGGCKIKTTISPNKKSSYQELDVKLAQICFNNFHLRFIKE